MSEQAQWVRCCARGRKKNRGVIVQYKNKCMDYVESRIQHVRFFRMSSLASLRQPRLLYVCEQSLATSQTSIRDTTLMKPCSLDQCLQPMVNTSGQSITKFSSSPFYVSSIGLELLA